MQKELFDDDYGTCGVAIIDEENNNDNDELDSDPDEDDESIGFFDRLVYLLVAHYSLLFKDICIDEFWNK
jgi:hypothetical protein